MNNKGFAISTVIYGMSILGMMLIVILMGVISSNRANNTKLVETIENELNGFSQSEISFSAKSETAVPVAQEYTVPDGESGWYKIELWGSAGGYNPSTKKFTGGRGAYVSGIIELHARDTLYFYIGNGSSAGNGGRETDVRYVSGTYTNQNSVDSRIMVAAGGGASATAHGGTLIGYDDKMISNIGEVNTTSDYGKKNPTLVGYPSNYTLTGVKTSGAGVNGLTETNVGGDGYKRSTINTIGGASYIAGSAGSGNGIKVQGEVYEDVEGSDEGSVSTKELNNFYFVDGMMYAGVNGGSGKARIERVKEKKNDSEELPKKNAELKTSIKAIRDCTEGVDVNYTNIVAMSKGESVGDLQQPSGNCRVLNNFDAIVDEIAVWHKKTGEKAGVDIENNKIEVSHDGTNWKVLKNTSSQTKYSETESPFGIRISAYQFDSTKELPNKGNYYILPVLSENRAMSVKDDSTESTFVEADYFQGLERQKWSIEKLTDSKIIEGGSGNEYKIVELLHNKALSITEDDNFVGNKVSAGRSFNNLARNEPQIWKITPIGNGTYIISTAFVSNESASETGNILPLKNNLGSGKTGFEIGKNNVDTERFKFISVDYSSG